MGKCKRCGIIFSFQDYLLVVRGRNGGIYSFPKGCKKIGETDIECAIRECEEETGIKVDTNISYPFLKLSGNCYYLIESNSLFFVDDKNIKDKNEIDKVEWIKKEILKTLPCNKDLRRFLHYFQNKTTSL